MDSLDVADEDTNVRTSISKGLESQRGPRVTASSLKQQHSFRLEENDTLDLFKDRENPKGKHSTPPAMVSAGKGVTVAKVYNQPFHTGAKRKLLNFVSPAHPTVMHLPSSMSETGRFHDMFVLNDFI